MKFTIALAQIDPVLGDMAQNVALHHARAQKAHAAGAALVVFPELSLTGYSIKDMNWDLGWNPSTPPPEMQPLLDISRSISILAGGVEEAADFALYNSAFLFENGAVVSAHRKVYPPTYGMFEELRYFSPGTTVRPVQTKLGPVGVLICEDLWHMPLPYLLAHQGAQVIVAPVASPTRLAGRSDPLPTAVVNRENHRAFARLLTTYLVFCNRVGYEDGVNFWGGSSVIAPDGEVVVEAKTFDEDMVFATIDSDEVRRARRFSRHFLDDDPRIVLEELQRLSKR